MGRVFVIISEMDLTPNICIACCMIHSKTSLTQLVMTSNGSLSKILMPDCPQNLAICTNCNLKLEGFREFIEKLKNKFRKLSNYRCNQRCKYCECVRLINEQYQYCY